MKNNRFFNTVLVLCLSAVMGGDIMIDLGDKELGLTLMITGAAVAVVLVASELYRRGR